MKLFIKKIYGCQACPKVRYHHADGEGECAPYSYFWPYCSITHKTLHEFRDKHQPDWLGNDSPDVHIEIPDWCPLEDA